MSAQVKKLAVIIFIFCIGNVFFADTERNENKPVNFQSPAPKKKLAPAKISSSYSRLCEKSDIIGFWKVIKWTPYFHIPAKDWDKPLYLKNQWYMFFENGAFSTMSAKKEQKNIEVKSKIVKAKTDLRYKFLDKGIVEMFHQRNTKLKETWRCALVTSKLEKGVSDTQIEKGDVFMSLLDSNNSVIYVRHMRKIK